MSKIFVFYFSFFLVNIYLFVFYPLFVPCFLSPPSLSCPFHPLCLAFLLLQSLQPLSSSPPQSAGLNLTLLNYLAAPVRAHLLTHVSQSVSTVSVGDTRSLSSSRSHTARGTHDDDDDGLLDRDARPESARGLRPPGLSHAPLPADYKRYQPTTFTTAAANDSPAVFAYCSRDQDVRDKSHQIPSATWSLGVYVLWRLLQHVLFNERRGGTWFDYVSFVCLFVCLFLPWLRSSQVMSFGMMVHFRCGAWTHLWWNFFFLKWQLLRYNFFLKCRLNDRFLQNLNPVDGRAWKS